MMSSDEARTPVPPGTVEDSMDYQAISAVRSSSSGGWKSARLIICVEMAERFAFYGISSNLITYLTGPLGQSTANAAANVNAWNGTVSFLPLLCAFVADSFLGCFRTIIIASSLYILGLGLLTFSATIPTSECEVLNQLVPCPSQFQVIIFFCSLYIIAIGQGGYKPCIKVFGADQFDGEDFNESKAKSSFFNWLMFGNCISILMSRLVITYIQENLSWFLGFGIPSTFMVLSLLLFLLGTSTYRFSTPRIGQNQNPFRRITRVFVMAIRNRREPVSDIANLEENFLLPVDQSLKQSSFLDKARISCDLADVEEAKVVLRLVPIWMTSLVYATVLAQSPTLFTKQGATMERSISPTLEVPAATLQSFTSLSIVIFVVFYDRLLVPISRSFTHKPTGFTKLQRIGIGIFLSILTMAIAAMVEAKRLRTARDHSSVDFTVPMSVLWLVPQYVLNGVSDVFTMVGLQELFYDQVPSELKSVGMALNLSIYGVGNFLSSFMISVINNVTSQSGQTSWFAEDLNQAHLDYFYWLLAGLSSVSLVLYLWFTKSYVYNNSH